MIFYALGSFSIVLFNIILWSFIFKKQERNNVVWSYLLWSAAVSGWALGYGITLSGWFSYPTTLFWNRFCHANASFIGIFFLQLTYALTGQLKRKKKQLIFLYFVGLSLLVLDCTPYFVKGLWEMGIFKYQPLGGPFYIYFTVVFFSTVTYSLFVLFRAMLKSKNAERGQIRIFLIGAIVGYAGGANLFFQAFGFNVLPIGVFFISSYVIFTGYAIYKYGFMDVRIIAASAMIFSFVYVPFLAIPFLVGHFFSHLSWAVPTFLQVIFAPVGLAVYQWLQSKAEKHILQEEYNQAREIRDLAGGLVRLDNAGELGKVIVGGLEKITGIINISLYVLKEDRTSYFVSRFCGESRGSEEIAPNNPLVEYLKTRREPVVLAELQNGTGEIVQVLTEKKSVIAIPAIEKGELMGIIFMGEKPDGRMYSQIELTALSVLASQVAFTVEIIQFIEEKEEVQRARNEMQRMKEFEYLTSAIGHEIGNGIQAIEVASSLLVRKRDIVNMFAGDEKAEESLKKQVANIRGNIENIRQVSAALKGYIRRGDAGAIEEVNLYDLIERVFVLAKVRNRGMKDIDLSIEGKANIFCNPTALQSVFSNMVNNSYDAIIQEKTYRKENNDTQEYTGSIEADIKDNEGIAQIHMRDNGIGMSKEVQDQIFIPLFTTKSHEEKKDERLTGGTGIGMFTIQKMLASQKGTIEIFKSAEHEGSEFLMKIRGVENDKNTGN